MNMTFVVNGATRTLEVDPSRTLLEVLREDLDLTGAKKACDGGECGSCIVLLGKKGVMSCLLPASRAQNKEITTIERLAPQYFEKVKAGSTFSGGLHPLQEAFIELGASQCGFCIPGIIMEAAALLDYKPNPSREDVIIRLSRNICRCTGYVKIVDAILYAADLMRGGQRRARETLINSPLVGQRLLRLDDLDKVTGTAKYAADLKMNGMLYAKILRSPHHHARILSIDTTEAESVLGVEAVITIKDIPGDPSMINAKPQSFLFAGSPENVLSSSGTTNWKGLDILQEKMDVALGWGKLPSFSIQAKPQPKIGLVPQDKVRFKGEAIAAVAAVTEEIAEEALKKIKVEYEPLPSVLNPVEAARSDVPLINPPVPNVVLNMALNFGDIDSGFDQADAVVEGTYTTPRHEHWFLESEAGLAYIDENGQLVLKSPTHKLFEMHDFVADLVGLEREKVRVICPPMGGNFGGREDHVHPGVIALLTLKTRKPVRIVYSREESLLGSSKWFGFNMKFKTAATRDGRLTAMVADLLADGGCWSHNPGESPNDNMTQNVFFATGPYNIPNVQITCNEACTNSPRAVPIRGVFSLSVATAYEAQMDMLAARLSIDPLEFRLKNALETGSSIHTGQVLNESVGVKPTLEALRSHYTQALSRKALDPPLSPWKRGVGIAAGWKGVGGTVVRRAGVEILEDGRVRVLSGAVEKGQGITTALAQIAGQTLGLSPESLEMVMGDTILAPYPHTTSGQASVMHMGGAVLDASKNLKQALIEAAAEMIEDIPSNIVLRGEHAFSIQAPDEQISMAQLARYLREKECPTRYEGTCACRDAELAGVDGGSKGSLVGVYGYASALSEVDVNVETGEVRVRKVVLAADTGKTINPHTYEGQCEGGVVFGLGLALKQRYIPGEIRPMREELPTIKDMPEEITVLTVEEPASTGPFGAKGGAEESDMPTVAAILNAISNAIGKRVYQIPATPEAILMALDRK